MLLAITLSERFDQPAALWLTLLPVLLWWLSRRSLAGLSPGRRRAALAARAAVIVLLALALAGLHRIRINRDLAVIVLLDQSRSVRSTEQESARRFARVATRNAPPNDRVGAITFDGEGYIEQLPTKPGPDGGLYADARLVSPANAPDRTNIAAAVRLALACFPQDTAKRIVLVSDGNQNVGDVLTEVKTAAAANVAVDVAPIRYEYGNEVLFERLAAPAYAREQEIASLRLTLRSRGDRPVPGRIRLFHDGQLLPLDPQSETGGQRVVLQPGLNSFTLRVPLNHPGAHRFEARFEPENVIDDQVAANNVATAFTQVEGPATVLLLSADPAVDQPLAAALEREQIRTDVRTVAEIDIDAVSLQQYAAVIISNVPADQLNDAQHRALATYVSDLGGGLVMLGGPEGFGAGGWQSSIVESIMPVRFDVDAVRQIPRGALAIVMHACEMPQGNLWGVETAVAAMKTLSSLDYFGIVAFLNLGPSWAIPMRLCDDKNTIAAQIRRMNHGDAPSFDDLMDLAFKGLISRRDAAQRHMIIISDGDPSPPSTGLVKRLVSNRVTVSTVSVFPHGGLEIGTMKNIAQQTGGNYYNLSRPGDEKRLPQIFIKEAKVVRRPLLREEEFTPQVKYRLSDLLAGIRGGFPPLTGYVVTTPRPTGAIELPLVTDKGDPLLANWQAGLGRTIAFTSGWWNHWATEWVQWPSFSKFWAQSLRWCMAQGTAKDFEVNTFVDGTRARVVVEALNQEADYLNFLRMQGIVVAPSGESAPLRLDQTGPGRYEGSFTMPAAGNFLVNIQASAGEGADAKPVLIRTGVSQAYSPEFKDLATNESLLRKIAEVGNGRWLDLPPEEADLFARNLPLTFSRQPLWSTLLKWAIVMFLIDVAVRRIALDPRKGLAWVRSYIADVAGRVGAGRRAEAVLTDLKGVRDKVKTEKTGAGQAPPAPSVYVEPGRKFDAPGGTTKPSGDLTQALGGAKPAGDKPPDKPVKPVGDETTTSRLLKSKKRRTGGDEAT